ncbi:MAG: Mov34/MPN/PAD-1 family protein [Phycisphaerae bacterium]|jgi:integrative and conjugative element protein (TIGR02256 family)
MTGNYEAWSKDKKYGLRIPSEVLQKMLSFCQKAGNMETGGILVGYYNRHHDCAIITDCSNPPRDSKCGENYFYRGVHGLQKWLIRLWHLGQQMYYLGEWHFHPFANPNPSDIDIKQLRSNAGNKSYNCPEPVIFIIGGNPNNKWLCKPLVYIRDKEAIELFKQWEK